MGLFTAPELVALLEQVSASDLVPPVIQSKTMPDFNTMAAIAMMESEGWPFAAHKNADGSIDRGLWQINSVHSEELNRLFCESPPKVALSFDFRSMCYTAFWNAVFAVWVWQQQGYEAWTTFKKLP